MHDGSVQQSLRQSNRELERLEQELEQARRHGRWLADDEIAALEQQRQQQQLQRVQRRKLWILTGVCVVIPPLWPLALGLVLFQLFPRTTRRFGLIAGIVVLSIGVLLAVLLLMLVVAVVVALL